MKVCEMIEKLQKRQDQDEEICSIIWCEEDVRGTAEEDLSDEQVKNIMFAMERCHDATIGINWDVITCHIENELNTK